MNGLTWRVWTASGLVAAGIALTAAPAAPATTAVEVGKTRFTPARVEVALGDSVLWEAADEGHTVTAKDGSFDSSQRGLMDEGDQYRYRFRTAGTFSYFCRVHQSRGMVGEIVVVDPSAPAATTSTTRLAPVTAAAPSTPVTTASTVPTTTTTRPLATSSSTSPAVATSTTAPVGTAVLPNEPPAINPGTPVIGSSASSRGEDLPGVQAAGSTSDGSGGGQSGLVVALVALAAAGLAGGTLLGARRRRSGVSPASRSRRGPSS